MPGRARSSAAGGRRVSNSFGGDDGGGVSGDEGGGVHTRLRGRGVVSAMRDASRKKVSEIGAFYHVLAKANITCEWYACIYCRIRWYNWSVS